VTPEQLSARGGKVRCGACQQVFNALDYLLDDAITEIVEDSPAKSSFPSIHPEMAPGGMPLTPRKTALSEAPPSAPQQATAQTATQAAAPVAPASPPPVNSQGAPQAAPQNVPQAAPQRTTFDDPDTTLAPEVIIDPVTPNDLAPVNREGAGAIAGAMSISSAEIAKLSPEEVKQLGREAGLIAPRDQTEIPGFSAWSGGMISASSPRTYALWPFVVMSIFFSLLLAAQLAYHYRGDLARGNPGIQNSYAAFGIEIPLPRETARISIDASELQTVADANSDDPTAYNGHLQLITTLKNQASYPQAWPHLEIALTDAYDAVLTRRILKPNEYLPADAPLAFAAGETQVTLDLNVGALKPNGYRLTLLYP
jgi:hypothetical protein